MNHETRRKLGILLGLYLSQGIPHGFFFTAAPVLFRERGMPLEYIGISYLLSLPWAVKFLVAPFVDRYYNKRIGARRSWILPLQSMSIISMFVLAIWDPSADLMVMFAAIFVMNMTTALQDIPTDGYAVDLLEADERGWANGIQVSGYSLGYILGGGVMLVIYDMLGWSMVMNTMGAILLVAMLPVLLRREKPKLVSLEEPVVVGEDAEGHLVTRKHSLFGFRTFTRRSGAWALILLLVIYRFPSGFTQTLSNTMMVDWHWDSVDIGTAQTVATVASVIGGILGGAFANVLGRKGSLITFGLVRIASMLALVGAASYQWSDTTLFTAVVAFDRAVFSMLTVAAFALMMDWAREERSATDYTILDSFGVFATIFGVVAAGIIAGQMSYSAAFIAGLLFSLLAVVMVHILFRMPPEKEV